MSLLKSLFNTKFDTKPDTKSKTNVIIKNVCNSSLPPRSVELNLLDNLSKIREELIGFCIIDDTLSFAQKCSENDEEFSEIMDEGVLLRDYVHKKGNTYFLYLTINIWKFLNINYQLDYGCIVTSDEIRRASKRAFEMMKCNLTETGSGGHQQGNVEYKVDKDQMRNRNLFFGADINVHNLGIGMSIGATKNEKFNIATDKIYHFERYHKATLKILELKPTTEFIQRVKDAINSKDPENFKQIIREYEYIGGEPNSENFDVKTWIESLKDPKSWNCIELRELVSIFQLLPEDLHKQIIESVGKKIHYSAVKDFDYDLKIGKPVKFQLPQDIQDRLKNADCNIFATVIDTEKSNGNYFTCQILHPPNKKACLLIHYVKICDSTLQKVQRVIQKECKKKLKIRLMLIGKYTDLNLIPLDLSARLSILKVKFNKLDSNFSTELLKLECDSEDCLCLGIPVLSNESNKTIIGHYFFDTYKGISDERNANGENNNERNANGGNANGRNADEENVDENNKINACVFSCCSEKYCHKGLPDFSFHVLIISNFHNHNACMLSSFDSKKKKKYIEIQDNPRFISILSTKQIDCIFLKQSNKRIEIKQINCGCDKDLSSDVKCVSFDPPMSCAEVAENIFIKKSDIKIII
ncbi:hypothetical protein RclHR1_07480002 [Rhizophagus clarus]|uniref:DUF7431 domain-containing protein n=1 Tax=Rhizophagus clarus TaxID=94130 RepID=A0A2Z6SD40_9GLOM|nr:hypothetical protein RclHR1_07480002 [Rhizophagus clarus]